MADSKGKGIQEAEPVAVPQVESITTETPSNADKTSNPVDNDAQANQPPVRTNRPDVPIAQVLAAGAGAHEGRVLDRTVDVGGVDVEVDKDGIDRDGRFVGEPSKK